MLASNSLSHLPPWITRWLGFRAEPPVPRPQYIVWMWSFIGAFCGMSLIQAVFGQAPYFIERGVPSIVASYCGPRVWRNRITFSTTQALYGGHFIGALIGICVAKLFHLLPTEERFQSLIWLAGSLSCATAIVVMQMTGTTHPPAGATALLAAVNDDIRNIGWYYLPVVLLSSTLVLAVAMINNNIQRRYPVFWLKPNSPKQVPSKNFTENAAKASDNPPV